MARDLTVSIGQHSSAGRKPANQDFHGALIPDPPLRAAKGIAIAIADGISSSDVGHIAAESAVKSFLMDYYCTADAWSVKTSAQRVISATNSWLHAQSRRGGRGYEQDRGYVCTLTVLVLKSATAHVFHIGDCRAYRMSGGSLEQLTDDHRIAVSSEQSYLSRALGVNPQVEIDYRQIPMERGDVFVLATDGVYDHLEARFIADLIGTGADDLDGAARAIVDAAFTRGSADNLTVQIVRIDTLSAGEAEEILGQATDLPPAPPLQARMMLDGYRILRQIHASARSHIWLATDSDDNSTVAIKIPATDLRDDPAHLRRFMMEEWVARRINSAHVLKPRAPTRPRTCLYVVMEFVDGQSLAQWMADHPRPDLETVRGIVEQIARGLRAFHRLEMLHQDLRPENIMIDRAGTVKIIDFGSTRIAGVTEARPVGIDEPILGTVQYTAPEYFLGAPASVRSDVFSLGVIAYQMLTDALPYGTQVANARTRAQQRRLRYRAATERNHALPDWIDATLRKAVQIDPRARHEEPSEFAYDLRHPNPDFQPDGKRPMIEANPLLFWKLLSGVLAAALLALLGLTVGGK